MLRCLELRQRLHMPTSLSASSRLIISRPHTAHSRRYPVTGKVRHSEHKGRYRPHTTHTHLKFASRISNFSTQSRRQPTTLGESVFLSKRIKDHPLLSFARSYFASCQLCTSDSQQLLAMALYRSLDLSFWIAKARWIGSWHSCNYFLFRLPRSLILSSFCPLPSSPLASSHSRGDGRGRRTELICTRSYEESTTVYPSVLIKWLGSSVIIVPQIYVYICTSDCSA